MLVHNWSGKFFCGNRTLLGPRHIMGPFAISAVVTLASYLGMHVGDEKRFPSDVQLLMANERHVTLHVVMRHLLQNGTASCL